MLGVKVQQRQLKPTLTFDALLMQKSLLSGLLHQLERQYYEAILTDERNAIFYCDDSYT